MNSKSKQTIFFIDRCLGKHPILEKLRATGITVLTHDDHFPENTLDADWIPKVAKWGWVILTKDASIARNPLERQAVARAKIRMFTLASAELTGEEIAIAFQKALNPMLKFIKKNDPPFIAKVYRDGKVSAWKDADNLLREIND